MIWSVGLLYVLLECVQYYRHSQHVARLNRPCRHNSTQATEALAALVRKNGGIQTVLWRMQEFGSVRSLKHIRTSADLERATASTASSNAPEPAHVWCIGRSRLQWAYRPMLMEGSLWCIRAIGELRMYQTGFKRTDHPTIDGTYCVWTKRVDGTRPLLVFPGLGLGAIPYASIAASFGRTVHVVEVPNFGPASSRSDTHGTSHTLYTVVAAHVPDHTLDILAHSFGTAVATTYLNVVQLLSADALPVQQAVFCDGFTHSTDFVRSMLYPFVDSSDRGQHVGLHVSLLEYRIFLRFAMQKYEFATFAKRSHTLYDGTLWRAYPTVRMLHVYGTHDMLYDVPYIRSRSSDTEMEQFLFVEQGKHGACLFGPRNVVAAIDTWFNERLDPM